MKRSQLFMHGVDVCCAFLLVYNIVMIVTKDYCIHDLNVSAVSIVLITIFAAGALFFKWKETKIP